MNVDYFKYTLLSMEDYLHAIGNGTTFMELSSTTLENVRLPVPSRAEQDDVTTYLDAETAHIDSLIDEQFRFQDLLVERRAAAVFDAVTGRSVPGPRRSDIAWVDSLPAAWDVARLLRVAELGSGHTPARDRPELWTDCTIPWITTGEVQQIRSDVQEVLTETREMISEQGIAESAAVLHPKGTVVLCRTASAGYSAIMGLNMATSQDFATWTCGPRLDSHYLLYCLRAMRRDLLGRLALGSTHQTIYMPEIKSIEVPLPEIEEQREFVATLQQELKRIDRLHAAIDDQIALLREHRQALIAAAVANGLEGLGKAA
jgi:type I restriction enzyme S subunit